MNMMPNYQNPYTQFTPKYNMSNNSIVWVQGIEGAKAYQLAPNSNIILMDSENDRFYIKTSDNIGMCNLRIFKFTEITETSSNTQIDTSQFVTREEFNQLVNQLGGLDNGKQSISTIKSECNSNE